MFEDLYQMLAVEAQPGEMGDSGLPDVALATSPAFTGVRPTIQIKKGPVSRPPSDLQVLLD
jgi:hypothetical protein